MGGCDSSSGGGGQFLLPNPDGEVISGDNNSSSHSIIGVWVIVQGWAVGCGVEEEVVDYVSGRGSHNSSSSYRHREKSNNSPQSAPTIVTPLPLCHHLPFWSTLSQSCDCIEAMRIYLCTQPLVPVHWQHVLRCSFKTCFLKIIPSELYSLHPTSSLGLPRRYSRSSPTPSAQSTQEHAKHTLHCSRLPF